MKKLFKYIDSKFDQSQQVKFTEEDPTYGEAISYFVELFKRNWISITVIIIALILTKYI